MSKRIANQFLKDANGGIAIIFGLVIPTLIGFTGLGVDAAYWMVQRNKLQAATDSAAISVAQAVQLDGANAAKTAEASKLFTKIYGPQGSTVRFQVQHPPTSGPSAGDISTVEVLAEKDQPIFFLSAFGVDDVVVRTRAVARIDSVAEACLLSLDKTEDKGIEVTGTADVTLGCGIASNSTTAESVYLSGNAKVTTTGVSAAGDIEIKNNATLKTNGGPVKSHAQPLKDPYGPEGRNLQAPTIPTACTQSSMKIKKNTTLTPGRYCGGIDFQNGTATLQPGTYIMDGGAFKANGQASIVGNGVTIILTGTGSDTAYLDVNGGAQLSLHAPKTGTAYNGVLFFQDSKQEAKAGQCNPGQVNTNNLNGGASMDLSGAMYFPNQMLRYSGGTSTNISCLQMVALRVQFSGNSKVTSTCDANSGTERIARTSIKLTE